MRPQYIRLLVAWGIWGPIAGALLIWFLTINAYIYAAFLIVVSGVVIVLPLIWDWLVFQINRTLLGKAVLARYHPTGKVAADVATYLNRGIKTQKGAFLGYRLPAVEIVWARKPTRLVKEIEGEAIIYLEPNLDNEEGLLMALEEYVNMMFMDTVKAICGENLANGIKLILMESLGEEFLTRNTKMKALYADAIRKLIPVETDKKENFNTFLATLRSIVKGGMFESIFMYFIRFIADNLTLGRIGSESIEETLIRFATYLETICTKRHGEDVQLDFIESIESDVVKIHIILITRSEASSLRSHLEYLVRYCRQGFNPIFVSGMGKNTKRVDDFLKKAKELREGSVLPPFQILEAKSKAFKEDSQYEVRTYAIEFRWEQAR